MPCKLARGLRSSRSQLQSWRSQLPPPGRDAAPNPRLRRTSRGACCCWYSPTDGSTPDVQRLPLQGRLLLISLISLSSHIFWSSFEAVRGGGAGPLKETGDVREPLLHTSFELPHNLLKLVSLERCSCVLSGMSLEPHLVPEGRGGTR